MYIGPKIMSKKCHPVSFKAIANTKVADQDLLDSGRLTFVTGVQQSPSVFLPGVFKFVGRQGSLRN